ncbi:MAG: RNA polymerase sigma factor [Planctomycetota bacterium]|jgi:RNA polymerase sigma-70 factor (ECF subfamily)
MRSGETRLGGPRRGFPNTTWGLISRLHATGDERWKSALETLCRRYWKPVYWYIRSSWAKNNEDGKDLTQAFFLWLMEGEALKRYDPGRAGFRWYLKILLGGFVGQQEIALKRLKRGGGAVIIRLDDESDTVDDIPADAAGTDPEKLFDEAWMMEIVHHALERTREVCVTKGRLKDFELFEEYDMPKTTEDLTYAELGKRQGLREREVERKLALVREELRAQVRAELARTVTGEEELEKEWNELFGS